MIVESFYSSNTKYYSDEEIAYNEAYNNIPYEHFDILSVEYHWSYCEGCGDYHCVCEICITRPHNTPTDMEIKLREALGL